MQRYRVFLKSPLFAIIVFTLAWISGHSYSSLILQTADASSQQVSNPSEPQYTGQLYREVMSSADYIQLMLSTGTDQSSRWQVADLSTTAGGTAPKAAYIRNKEGDLFYIQQVDSESLLLTFATRRNILLIRKIDLKVNNKPVLDATGQLPIPLVQQNMAGDGMNGFHICILHGKRNPRNDPFINKLVYGSTLAIEFYGEQDKLERVQFSLKNSMASIRQVLK